MSNDGRYVAFESRSNNLTQGDTNNEPDIFLRDRVARTTSRVSLAAGKQADGASSKGLISGNGRYVVFGSQAPNLGVPPRSHGTFVFDREIRTTTRVDVAADGTLPDSGSGPEAVSDDGNIVLFSSGATNLVPGAVDTNSTSDLFVKNRSTGVVQAVPNPGSIETREGQLSPNGRYVLFLAKRRDYTPFVWDRVTNTTIIATVAANGEMPDSQTRPGRIRDDGSIVFNATGTNLLAEKIPNMPTVYLRTWNSGPFRDATLVVGNKAALTAGDQLLAKRLRYLGFRVAYVNDESSPVTGGKELVVISESVDPAVLGSKYKWTSVGVVSMEPLAWDAAGLTSRDGQYITETRIVGKPGGALTQTQTTDVLHLYNLKRPIGSADTAELTSSAVTVATVYSAQRPAAFLYQKGAPMWGLKAPGRRLAIGIPETAAGRLTKPGVIFLEQLFAWTAGT